MSRSSTVIETSRYPLNENNVTRDSLFDGDGVPSDKVLVPHQRKLAVELGNSYI